ncbi:hypothetical protein C3L33_22527, partial [Rhododendron williamsianum]
MEENNARLKAAGVNSILVDLRGSSLPNCMNEKRRGTRNGVDDPDYMPPSIEDANDDESLDSLEHELQQMPSSGPTRSQVELQHDLTRVLERMTRSTPHLVVESQPSPPRNVEIQSEATTGSSTVAPNRRGRGISRGLDIQRLVDKSWKLLVPIPPEYRAPVGIYASKLASKIGVEVRAQVEDLSIKSWKAVDEGIKAPLLQSLKIGRANPVFSLFLDLTNACNIDVLFGVCDCGRWNSKKDTLQKLAPRWCSILERSMMLFENPRA